MTLLQEFTKLKNAKTKIRKSIERRNTGLTYQEIYSTYPPYIQSINHQRREVNNEGLLQYCDDYTTTFAVKTSVIRDYAFYDYTNLHNLVIDYTDGVVELQGIHAFERTSLKKIYVPASLVSQYKSAPNWATFKDIITSGTPATYKETNLIEHELARTVEFVNSLTIEDIITDRR